MQSTGIAGSDPPAAAGTKHNAVDRVVMTFERAEQRSGAKVPACFVALRESARSLQYRIVLEQQQQRHCTRKEVESECIAMGSTTPVPEGSSTQPIDRPAQARGIALKDRLIGRLVGYDVFIAYRKTQARDYARALKEVLQRHGLLVFLDESDEGAGAEIEGFTSIASTARCLVVIVTPGIFESKFVKAEVDGYLERLRSWRKRPFSRLLPIDVGHSLSAAPRDVQAWTSLSSYVFTPEGFVELAAAQPSQAVVDQVRRSSRFIRATALFAAGMATALVTVAIAVALAAFGLIDIRSRLEAATIATDQKTKELAQASRALKDVQRQSDELTKHVSVLTAKASQATQKVDAAEARNRALVVEGRSLEMSRDAASLLESDPDAAYRLAESANSLSPTPASQRIMRQVLSSRQLHYLWRADDCTVYDVMERRVLLRCGPPAGLKVMDLNSSQVVHLGAASATEAWLVPLPSGGWNVLANERSERGGYRLLSSNGHQLGSSIPWPALTPPDKRCGRTLALIPIRDALSWDDGAGGIVSVTRGDVVRWDLVSGRRIVVRQGPVRRDASRWESEMGCRADGLRARQDGLTNLIWLIDGEGRAVEDSVTPGANYDYLYSNTEWSANGRRLAIWISAGRRLGVWSPSQRTFRWLDPKNWVVTSHAWSADGRVLAYAGNTEHQLDVAVSVLDEGTETHPKVIYRGNRAIRSLAFAPDGRRLAMLDDQGSVIQQDMVDGKSMHVARHPGATRIAWMEHALVTWSKDQARVWPTDPDPSSEWLLESDEGRVFAPCSTTDRLGRWLVATAVSRNPRAEDRRFVVVRDLLNHSERRLETPDDSCQDVRISRDGNWLAFTGWKHAVIWNTQTWEATPVPLDEGDHQFMGIRPTPTGFDFEVVQRGSDTKRAVYQISIDSSGPRRAARRNGELAERNCGAAPDALTAGWRDAVDHSKYRVRGRSACPGEQWERRVWCRDQALGAQDCDIEFVPLDLTWLQHTYDHRIWRGDAKTLRRSPRRPQRRSCSASRSDRPGAERRRQRPYWMESAAASASPVDHGPWSRSSSMRPKSPLRRPLETSETLSLARLRHQPICGLRLQRLCVQGSPLDRRRPRPGL